MHLSTAMNTRSIKCLLLSICLLASLSTAASRQDTLQLSVQIGMKKATLSGICMMAIDSNRMVKGAVINEFGVKAFDVIYDERKHKVHLINVMSMLDKWYIRRILRRDLRKIIPQLITRGSCEYTDLKYGIDYIFKPLEQEHNAISE